MNAVQIWRSGGVQHQVEEVSAPAVECLAYEALSEWHFGEIVSCQTNMSEAIVLAKELNDMHALAFALWHAAFLRACERNPAEVERLASDLIELSTRQNFAGWLPGGVVLRGWARSASGKLAEGIACIEDGIRDYQATGAILRLPFFLALKAEALQLANRTPEALQAIQEAEAVSERFENRYWSAELLRLRGLFLATIGADDNLIEVSLSAAMRTAKEQKSISLATRAEGTYAEYRRQKASGLGGQGFRLPLFAN
jgi:predicted ATPase